MTCRTFKHAALLSLLAVYVAGCQGSLTDADPDFGDPLTEIFDGTNPAEGANPRFFFLTPMVDDPGPFIGEPDGELVPVVSICAGHEENVCLDSEIFKENASLQGDHYQVNWRTRGVPLGDYTVNVRAGKFLGFADVTVQKKVKGNGRGDVFLVKSGSTLPVKFRIEEGALCDPPVGDDELGERECATQTVDLSEGGTVVLDIGNEGDGTATGVDVQAQAGGPNVTFIVQPCLDANDNPVDLGLDIPMFGFCFDVVALDEDGEPLNNAALTNPAIVFACIEFGDLNVDDDLNVGDLTNAQAELIRIHRKDDLDHVQALPLREAPCATLGGSAAPTGLMRFARFLGDKVFSLVGPKQLHARRRRIDFLQGGAPPFFSQFQWALPAKMEKVAETDDQDALVGDPVANRPKVLVTDAEDQPVKGAKVTFVAAGGDLTVVNPVVTGSLGTAAVTSWTPTVVGEIQLTASGFGISDGPDPFTPIPGACLPGDCPDTGPEVDLAVGEVVFAAEGVDPVVVLDFEGLTDLVSVTDDFADLGVTFTGATVLRSDGSLSSLFPPNSGLGVIFDFTLAFGGVVTADFSSQVLNVGGFVTGNTIVTLSCFDSSNNSLGSASTPAANRVGAGTGVDPNFFLEVDAPGIVMCTFADGGNTYTVDDFTFTRTALN